jgi:4-amino-4-deoxy-L-arabinose transferase-like glycosyltransferase
LISSKFAILSVSSAVLLGIFLRFFHLDLMGLWVDEIHTLGPAMHAKTLAEGLWHYIVLAPTPPLYYYFMVFWSSLFGFEEWYLRLPSAIFGSMTIAVFWIGLRKAYGAPFASLASILMALSWPSIYYSQEVRTYSILLLFTTAGATVWMWMLENCPVARWPHVLSLWLFGALASMSHPFGFLAAGFMLLYLFVASFPHRILSIQLFVAGCALAVLYGTWTAINLTGLGWVIGQKNMFTAPDIRFLVDVGAFLFHHPIVAVLTFGIPLILGGRGYVLNLSLALRHRNLAAPEIYLPFMIIAPFATAFVAAQFKPFVYTRYLIVFLPFIYVFFALLMSSGEKLSPASRQIVMAIAAILATLWFIPDHYKVEKPQTREMAAYVLQELKPNDVLLTGCETGPPFECAVGPGRNTDADWSKYLYYLNYATLPKTPIVPDVFNNLSELDQILAGYQANGNKRVFIIGSRAGERYVFEALNHMKNKLGPCKSQKFHLATASICEIN